MVGPVPDSPSAGIDFHHLLRISQQLGGLGLCTSLLQNYFIVDWKRVDFTACCEGGGFVFGSALASRVDMPLVLIREADKLPSPTISVVKHPSHISSMALSNEKEARIELERDTIQVGASVVVVADALSTGATLCAVVWLLEEAGIDVKILVF